MEIKFNNLSYKEKNKYILKNINLKIKDNLITGIYGENKEIIARLISEVMDYQGIILFDNMNLLGYDLKKISYIKKINKNTFLTRTVSDEFYLRKQNINVKETVYLDKIISSLKMVGLDKEYLKRDINTLSKSEKRLLLIALNLISNPELIIIDESYLYLDRNGKYIVKKILKDLKNKYHKTIIILSLNSNILYELCDDLIILKDNQVLISGNIKTLFNDYEYLEENKVKLPDLVRTKKLLMEKNIDLGNFKDIDDLVKGVYDYVRKTKEDSW